MSSIDNYDSYYDDPFITGRATKKMGKSSTRKKSTESETDKGIICNAVCVKVREAPDPSSKVISVAHSKERVKILDKIGKYYKVEMKRLEEEEPVTGYILLDFCKKEV